MHPKTRPATIHLDILGQQRAIDLRVRTGPTSLRDLLTVARSISDQITAIAVEHAASQGEPVTCRSGCAACCRQLVPISSVEARALAELVAAMPPRRQREVRRRFAAAVERMEALGLIDAKAPRGRFALVSDATGAAAAWDDVSRRYFAAGIECPLLEDERCSAYAERPMTCREYYVVTPRAWCDELKMRAIERPARMSEALADAANAIAEVDFPSIPLPLALEWAEVHAGSLALKHDGESMYWTLLEHMGSETGVQRGG